MNDKSPQSCSVGSVRKGRSCSLPVGAQTACNLKKLELDLAAALQAQDEARAKVRFAASGQPLDAPMPDPTAYYLGSRPVVRGHLHGAMSPKLDDAALRSVLERACRLQLMTPPRRVLMPLAWTPLAQCGQSAQSSHRYRPQA